MEEGEGGCKSSPVYSWKTATAYSKQYETLPNPNAFNAKYVCNGGFFGSRRYQQERSIEMESDPQRSL